MPKQLLVRASKNGNKTTDLLFDTSIFDLRLVLPPKEDMETKDGLRLFTLPASLIGCSPSHFAARAMEMRAGLVMIRDAPNVLNRLLAGGHSKIAARLAGTMHNIGRDQIADNIVETMQAAGYTVNESDPFEGSTPITFSARGCSEGFPSAPGLVKNRTSCVRQVDEVYVSDAYNLLSIEGYKVSADLIGRVRSGKWNPDTIKSDQNHRGALAARGY